MNMRSIGRRLAIAYLSLAVGLAASLPAAAASSARELCDQQFSPRSGQAGKDVIWVPTLDALVTAMLKAAKVGPDDYLIDLGSGDGKIPIAAAKQFGARALGIEYNPQMVQLARCYVRAEHLEGKVEIRRADIFQTDFSEATVLTLYLLSDLNLKLRPRILEMKPGTRVVSNTFKMGDWSPDQFIESEIGNTRAYLWIVPAQVAGTWEFRDESGADSFRIVIDQHYQELKVATPPQQPARIAAEGRLRGAQIELISTDTPSGKLEGDVNGNTMRLVGREGARTVVYLGSRVTEGDGQQGDREGDG